MKQLLRKNYSPTEPLVFHEFDGWYHGHFNALYNHTGFGGDEEGAVYVWPQRILRGQLICHLVARGKHSAYHDTYQAMPASACRFYNTYGDQVTAEEALGMVVPQKAQFEY